MRPTAPLGEANRILYEFDGRHWAEVFFSVPQGLALISRAGPTFGSNSPPAAPRGNFHSKRLFCTGFQLCFHGFHVCCLSLSMQPRSEETQVIIRRNPFTKGGMRHCCLADRCEHEPITYTFRHGTYMRVVLIY